jgi:hypothetical protein
MTRLGRLGSAASAIETPLPGRAVDSGPESLTQEFSIAGEMASGKDYRESGERQEVSRRFK